MRALESKLQSQEDSLNSQVQLQEIKDKHAEEISALTLHFEEAKGALQKELDSASEAIQDLESSI